MARTTLEQIQRWRTDGVRFAMLTAYDYPTAACAALAEIPLLLVGDSLGCVVLGHSNTRAVPLELMIPLAQAVRRGAPQAFLVGDLPFEAMQGGSAAVRAAARRFRDEAGCDAVKLETQREDAALVRHVVDDGHVVIAHLGLRPQMVEHPDHYRAQARDDASVQSLVEDARILTAAGAQILLLEAVPNEASQAVIAAVAAPVIGCGAGAACHGHVVVTHDMLGFALTRPPRFVPVLANVMEITRSAMLRYRESITSGDYPAPEHTYPMRSRPPESA